MHSHLCRFSTNCVFRPLTATKWLAFSDLIAKIRRMTARAAGPASVTPQALEDRLIDFGADACCLLRKVPKDAVGIQISRQLVRSATSPAANYAEARAAESRRDFVHKMQICLKELRETSVWLRFTQRLIGRSEGIDELAEECNQLIAIFVKSISTAKMSRARRQQ